VMNGMIIRRCITLTHFCREMIQTDISDLAAKSRQHPTPIVRLRDV